METSDGQGGSSIDGGAAEQKARSPMVLSLVLGGRRRFEFLERRDRVEVRGVMSSFR